MTCSWKSPRFFTPSMCATRWVAPRHSLSGDGAWKFTSIFGPTSHATRSLEGMFPSPMVGGRGATQLGRVPWRRSKWGGGGAHPTEWCQTWCRVDHEDRHYWPGCPSWDINRAPPAKTISSISEGLLIYISAGWNHATAHLWIGSCMPRKRWIGCQQCTFISPSQGRHWGWCMCNLSATNLVTA